MSFLDVLKKFSPLDEETEAQVAAQQTQAPINPAAPQINVPFASVEDESLAVPEMTAASLLDQYAVPRPANYVAPKIQIPGGENDSNRQAEREKFDTDLEELREQYKANREGASKRQMYAEMMAALGNNIGTYVAGAQAKNSKASVQPVKTAQINIKDMVAGVDKRFDGDYDNLLKQYKGLKDGGLTDKDRLYANIAQAQLDSGAARMNANVENVDRNAGIRVGTSKLKDQGNNELSDKQKATIDDMDDTLAQIDSVIKDADKFKEKLGPNAADFEDAKTGRLGSLLTKASPIDKEYTKFRSNAKALKGAYQKVISGLTVSDTERKELEGYVPHERMPYDAFIANAEAFKKRVAEIRARNLKNTQKYQGKNVAGYTGPKADAPVDEAFEAKMQKAMAANPGATRAQIEAALKNRK